MATPHPVRPSARGPLASESNGDGKVTNPRDVLRTQKLILQGKCSNGEQTTADTRPVSHISAIVSLLQSHSSFRTGNLDLCLGLGVILPPLCFPHRHLMVIVMVSMTTGSARRVLAMCWHCLYAFNV